MKNSTHQFQTEEEEPSSQRLPVDAHEKGGLCIAKKGAPENKTDQPSSSLRELPGVSSRVYHSFAEAAAAVMDSSSPSLPSVPSTKIFDATMRNSPPAPPVFQSLESILKYDRRATHPITKKRLVASSTRHPVASAMPPNNFLLKQPSFDPSKERKGESIEESISVTTVTRQDHLNASAQTFLERALAKTDLRNAQGAASCNTLQTPSPISFASVQQTSTVEGNRRQFIDLPRYGNYNELEIWGESLLHGPTRKVRTLEDIDDVAQQEISLFLPKDCSYTFVPSSDNSCKRKALDLQDEAETSILPSTGEGKRADNTSQEVSTTTTTTAALTRCESEKSTGNGSHSSQQK